MLVRYPRQIEADLLRYYAVDVLHLGRGLSWRRFGVLMTMLPNDSVTSQAMARDAPKSVMTDEEEAKLWRLEHHLMAHVVDLLAAANWQRGGGKGKRPPPLERPGTKSREQVIKRRSTLSPEQKLAVLKSLAPPPDPSLGRRNP